MAIGVIMESSLFKRLTDSMKEVSTHPMLDIPTGQFVDGGIKQGEMITYAAYPRKTGPNYALIARLMTTLEQLEPNTRERWVAATNLLNCIGYSVTWKGCDVCPEVLWINTEGNADQEAKMIHDILHRDYTKEPRVDVSQLDGDAFYAKMKEILNSGATPFVVDSVSQDSTDLS